MAVVVLDEPICHGWAKANGEDPEQIYESQRLKEVIQEDLDKRAAEAGFNSLEKIKRFAYRKEQFTVENGFLTPSLKMMRHFAKKELKEIVNSLYEQD